MKIQNSEVNNNFTSIETKTNEDNVIAALPSYDNNRSAEKNVNKCILFERKMKVKTPPLLVI